MKELLCLVRRESRSLMEDRSAAKVMIKVTRLAIVAVARWVTLCAEEVIRNWVRWTRSEIEGGADHRQGPKDRKDVD
jgi:hypothetical protein